MTSTKTLGGPNVLLKWITGSHRQSKHHAAVCSDSDMQFVNRDPHRGQVHAKGACHGGHERKHEHDAVDHQVEGHKLVAPVVQVQSNEVLCVCHLRTWHTPLGNYCAVSTAVPAVCWCQVHRQQECKQGGAAHLVFGHGQAAEQIVCLHEVHLQNNGSGSDSGTLSTKKGHMSSL